MALPEPIDSPQDMDALARKYRVALERYFQKRLLAQADIDDLVQDVFLRLTRRGIDDIGNIEGYLFETAANVLKDRYRHQKAHRLDKQDVIDPGYVEDAAFSPERVLIGKEAVSEMASALQELPERTQKVFVLGRFQDLSHAAIAAKLGIAQSTVEKHMMRALAHLARRVAGS